jgi:hypothetical protein
VLASQEKKSDKVAKGQSSEKISKNKLNPYTISNSIVYM